MFAFRNRRMWLYGGMAMMTGVTTCVMNLDAQGPLPRRKYNAKRLNVFLIRHAESENNALHKVVKSKAEKLLTKLHKYFQGLEKTLKKYLRKN